MVFDANFAFDRPTTMHVQTARPFPSDITAVLVEQVKDLNKEPAYVRRVCSEASNNRVDDSERSFREALEHVRRVLSTPLPSKWDPRRAYRLADAPTLE